MPQVRWMLVLLGTFSLLACKDATQGARKTCEADASTCCDGSVCGSTGQALSGRVFDADTGRTISNAEIKAGAERTKSDGSGHFDLAAKQEAKQIAVAKEDYVDAERSAPDGGGYVEVFIKNVDKTVEFDAETGIKVVLPSGASLDIPGGAVRNAEGKVATGRMKLRLAEVDGFVRTQASSLPGNLEAEDEKGGKGQSAIHGALSITITDDKSQAMQVSAESKVVAELPAHKDDGASERIGFSYSEMKKRWVAEGKAKRGVNAEGKDVYTKDIDHLSWHGYGDFFSKLSCLRVCVEDRQQKGVTGAQVWVVGASFPGVSSLFTANDGCIASDVPVSQDVVLVAQADGSVSEPVSFTSSEVERAAAEDPAACDVVGPLVLGDAVQSTCPAGFSECGALCSDPITNGSECSMDGGMEPPEAGATEAGAPDATAGGDTPTLTDLTLAEATLSPAFSPTTYAYAVSVPLTVQTVSLTATFASEVSVTIDGSAVTSGVAWLSPDLTVGPNLFTLIVSQAGLPDNQYTLALVRGFDRQEAYVKASNAGMNDLFGGGVAISGNTLAVAARQEQSNATGINGDQTNNTGGLAGAVYVFVRSGTAWTQQAYLKASNTGAGDEFGHALALDGDTLVVSAWYEDSSSTQVYGIETDNSAKDSGAVYVFGRTGGVWSQQAYIKSSNSEAGDNFGTSVAISGDTIVVGAPFEASSSAGVDQDQGNNDRPGSGAAYVFQRNGSIWSQQAYLKASSPDVDDYFGFTAAIHGDTVAITAFSESSGATGVNQNQSDNSQGASGAVYVFTRNGVSWSQQAYLKASNTGAGDRFGSSLAMWGNTLAVGAYGESSNATTIDGDQSNNDATNAGAVYTFVRNGNVWTQEAYLKADNAELGDGFGTGLALYDQTLIVGANMESAGGSGVNSDGTNNAANASGAAYLFVRNATGWSQHAYLKASNPDPGDYFGESVAIWGDTPVVGAPREASASTGVNQAQDDDSTANAGAVYVYR